MTPSSVLVVKPSSLGDIVHTLPAVHCLKTTFPEAEFFWIANTDWLPLLEDNADLRAVIPFPRRKFRGFAGIPKFIQWCRDLSHLEPDLVLDFQGLFRSAWISRSVRGKSVLGLSDAREASRYHCHERAPVDANQHSVDRYLELARLAGADTSGPVSVSINPIQGIKEAIRCAPKPGPDRRLCPRTAVAIAYHSRYWMRYAIVRCCL